MSIFRMGVERKLLVSVGLTALVVTAAIGLSAFTVEKLHGIRAAVLRYGALQEESILTKELQLQVANVWQFLTDASLTQDRKVIEEEAKPALEAAARCVDRLIASSPDDPPHRQKLARLRDALPAMWSTGIQMFEAYATDHEAGNRLMDVYDRACDAVIRGAAEVTEKNRRDSETRMRELQAILSLAKNRLAGTAALSTVLGLAVIVISLLIRRTIVRTLAGIMAAVRELARGNLTVRVEGAESEGDIGAVKTAFQETTRSLSVLIGDVLSAADRLMGIADALKPNADRTLEAARGQSEQAGQVAAAAEEMSQTIGDVARTCAAAAELSSEAMGTAAQGKDVAERARAAAQEAASSNSELEATVSRLTQRVREIGGVVEVISDIADQTNLLALNAAIEAARAGEQGRGFAVVAGEVRSLAEKTMRATRDIAQRIETVQGEADHTRRSMHDASVLVGQTTEAFRQVGDVLDGIFASVQSVKDRITHIAAAVEQQSATTEEVSRNVEATSHRAEEIEAMTKTLQRELGSLVTTGEEMRRLTTRFVT
ncbi:MAG: methyl-accepting chemotaxis protein [Deltaproteobacteria bacterium]|nr:methyl-accepting chemotaxis protein [Deltaproteobacteria bacterium]